MKQNATWPGKLFNLSLLALGLGLVPVSQVMAQTFTNLHGFNGADGSDLQAGLIVSGGTLFGVADSGGSNGNGTVFALGIAGGGFTNLYSLSPTSGTLFHGTNRDGAYSDGTLLLSGNTLYGTVYYGGTNGVGTVFACNTNGAFTTLHSFSAGKTNLATGLFTNSDGFGPEVGLVLSGSTLYGTTEHGGTAGYGVVFRVNTNGAGFQNLHNFTNGPDGAIPHALVLAGSVLYGTAMGAKTNGNGAVFALNTNGSGFTTLHGFTATNISVLKSGSVSGPSITNRDGFAPSGLTLWGSLLYGTAGWGGTNGNGTVFVLDTNGTGFAILHHFAASRTNSTGVYTNSEGVHPFAFTGLVLSSNTLYGTANWGGNAGNGTVFALNTNGTGFKTLHGFTATNASGSNSDGVNPYAGLILSGNSLYGTARYGGTNNDGTVFSIYLGLAVTTTSLPSATNGIAYNQTLAASGGQTPYTWTNISGTLPPGLTLATNGVISGTPTNSGTNVFTVKAADTANNTATQALSLVVFGPPSVAMQLTNNSISITEGNSLGLTVSVSGTGPFSFQWQLNRTNLPNGRIATVAGNGNHGYLGNGGAAINAELNGPMGVAVDAAGNLFIADQYNNCVRAAGATGIITTVAGGGTNGLDDGIAATNAELSVPQGVAVDASGNLFVSDTGNDIIRKVGPDGFITTVAGNGTWGFSGDGGMAINAEFWQIIGVAVDTPGNLFIADQINGRIRQVWTNSVITTVAGGGTNGFGDGGAATNAELYFPQGVAVDATGNLFIADSYDNCIRKVGLDGVITTVAGNGSNFPGDGGAATNAQLNLPTGLALDATGNLLIADSGDNVIRELGTNGIINTVAGNWTNGYTGDGGAATNAELNGPVAAAVDSSGNLFIADYNNNVIREVVFVQGPTLILNDVGLGNAGAYDVVVSNPYGSVTSSVVIVKIPPFFTAPQIFGMTNFTFQLSGPAGSNYVLQASTNLSDWNSVSTSAIPVSGIVKITNAISGDNRRFFRVHLQ
jgi:uncharacterized repeat protein (TIGR03803 family)